MDTRLIHGHDIVTNNRFKRLVLHIVIYILILWCVRNKKFNVYVLKLILKLNYFIFLYLFDPNKELINWPIKPLITRLKGLKLTFLEMIESASENLQNVISQARYRMY